MAGIELHTSYICSGGTTTAGTAGGHVAPGFLFYCTGTGVGVSNAGVAVLQATFGQIAGPLQTATTTAKNTLITSSGGVSLWALKSNELQVHYDSNPDATKLIVPSNVCGAVTTQATTGGQTTYVPTTGTQATAGHTTYVVQPGDNLFRISLRFGRTMDAIAAANGITNYALIFVGQTLIIP
jgi:LysM repeat protein